MSHHDCHRYPYIDRDLSWMWFNHRILQEARRKDVPPLERLCFLGIYSNNLDEFFRVRMATISRLCELRGKDCHYEREHARKLRKEITDLDFRYAEEYADAIKEVTDDLAKENLIITDLDSLTDDDRHFIRCRFRSDVSGFISPVWLSKLRKFDRESDDHIYLAVTLDGPGRKTDYALIELPSPQCGRFICLPPTGDADRVMYLDDVVRFALPMIFPGMGYTDFKAYSFKFTKDAEMEVDNDLRIGPLQKIAKGVKSRRNGAALRVIYDRGMPRPLLKALMQKLRLDKLDTVQPSGRYHNHKDLMSFPAGGRQDLKYPVWKPVVRPELKQSGSLLQLISERDRFVQVPYHSFDYVVRMLQEAAVSKNVKEIRITLYRVARDSKIIEALICAARNGKKVTAVVELLARFDESSNISWAKKMQDAGINVIFGVEGLKVHSKIIQIEMRHGHRIALVGSGNFHEGNAKSYTDYFLMTAHKGINRDVASVFEFISHPYRPVGFRHLLVSPNEMRNHFIQLIDDEIHNHRRGRPAWIKIKVNHITDHEMVEKLYEASEAGVKVELLVRGNFSMKTGEKGISDNIRAVGIIDRYLEHSRIFIFCANGANKTFMGSADWMPRNLDNRVEVITPVYDPDIKADMLATVEDGMRDNCQARIADGTGRNIPVTPAPGDERFRSQKKIYDRYASEAAGQPEDKSAS